jgi:hypothetical protein
MKPKAILRFVLILFILGTIITLSMGVFNNNNESVTPSLYLNPLFLTYSSKTDYGIPAPWLSYTHNFTNFNPYHRGLGYVVPYAISEYTFQWFGFLEDVLVYTSILFLIPFFYYLTQKILYWRFGRNLDSQRDLIGQPD